MMLIAGRQIRKGCRAIAALVWTISRMRVHVTRQLLRLGKTMSANSTKNTRDMKKVIFALQMED